MIRFLKENDWTKVQRITLHQFHNIDLSYSAIDINEEGKIMSMVLTSPKPLINAFPAHSFPKTKQCKNAFAHYSEENNHQIVFLYKFDKNGKSLSNTFYFLLNSINPRGNHWWWCNKDELKSDKEFNKIKALLCPINNTKYFYSI